MRQLLTTYSYTIPTSHSVVYLQPVPFAAGEVRVRLDNPDTGTIAHTFTNSTGMDIVDGGSNSGLTIVDRVHAADKPTSDGTDDGIKVQGASGTTLRLEAGDDDTRIHVEQSDTSNSVTVTDTSNVQGHTITGSGITYLTIKTNGVDAAHYQGAGGDGSEGTDVYVPRLYSSTHLLVDTNTGTFDHIQIGDGYSISQQVSVSTGAGNDILTVQAFGQDDGADVLADFGNGDGGDLGLQNELIVNAAAIARLGVVSGGPHTVVVDTVDVTGVANLNVEDESLIGELHLEAGGDATIYADGTTITTFNVDTSAHASVEGQISVGAFNLNGTAAFTSDSDPSTATTLTFGGGTLDMNGGSNLTVGSLLDNSTGTVNAVDSSTLNVTGAEVDGTVTFNLVTGADVEVGDFTLSGTANVNGDPSAGGEAVTIATLTFSGSSGVLNANANGVVNVSELDVPAGDAGTINAANTSLVDI